MSNYIVVSSVSYAPISGEDEKVMEQTHKDLKDVVGQVARATTPDLIVLPETICRTCDEKVPEGPTTQLLAGLAREYNCYITVPVHQKEPKSEAVFNVLGLLDRQGRTGRHLPQVHSGLPGIRPRHASGSRSDADPHGIRAGRRGDLLRPELWRIAGRSTKSSSQNCYSSVPCTTAGWFRTSGRWTCRPTSSARSTGERPAPSSIHREPPWTRAITIEAGHPPASIWTLKWCISTRIGPDSTISQRKVRRGRAYRHHRGGGHIGDIQRVRGAYRSRYRRRVRTGAAVRLLRVVAGTADGASEVN